MKNLLKTMVVCLIVFCCCGQAMAGDRVPVYLGAKLGLSMMTADDVDNSTDVTNKAAVNKSSEDDTLTALGLAVGYDWGKSFDVPVRTELEYMYRTDFNYSADPTFTNAAVATKVDIDMNVQTLLFNAYLDIDTGTPFTPYIGAGLGWAFLESKGDVTVLATGAEDSEDNQETNLAWNIGAGVAYAFDENWSADLGYRYLDCGSMEWGDTSQLGLKADEITAHELLLGIRYTF